MRAHCRTQSLGQLPLTKVLGEQDYLFALLESETARWVVSPMCRDVDWDQPTPSDDMNRDMQGLVGIGLKPYDRQIAVVGPGFGHVGQVWERDTLHGNRWHGLRDSTALPDVASLWTASVFLATRLRVSSHGRYTNRGVRSDCRFRHPAPAEHYGPTGE